MVDWERVEELRAKGWEWREIAADPKVGFRPDASAGDPGRTLRALYRRVGRRAAPPVDKRGPMGGPAPERGRRWSLVRIGYFLVPVVGLWLLLAYFVPSPIGVLVPAIPYLGLALAGAAVLLIYGLRRATPGQRWSTVLRNTVIGGVLAGLVLAGTIGLVNLVVFGCPYLPPASSETPVPASPGWAQVPARAWQDNGRPVVYFYGAVWCPYCSASSWAIWKALTELGSVTGAPTSYSFGAPEPFPYTPEMVLAALQMGSSHSYPPAVAFQASEYTGSQDAVGPGTSSCYQSAYVSAYSGGSLPFVVIDGQYVHAMNTLVDPTYLTTWANGANGGASAVEHSVASETGAPWTGVGTETIQNQCCWVLALVARSLGTSVPVLSSEYGWSSAVTSEVWSDFNQTV